MWGFFLFAVGFIVLMAQGIKDGCTKSKPANWRFDRELYRKELTEGTVSNYKIQSGYYYRLMTEDEIKSQYPMFYTGSNK